MKFWNIVFNKKDDPLSGLLVIFGLVMLVSVSFLLLFYWCVRIQSIAKPGRR